MSSSFYFGIPSLSPAVSSRQSRARAPEARVSDHLPPSEEGNDLEMFLEPIPEPAVPVLLVSAVGAAMATAASGEGGGGPMTK